MDEQVSTVTSDDPASGAPILEGRNIVKRFGGAVAVDDVSLAVGAGEIHGLVGENGAGKSTLMRVLAGVLSPNQGVVEVAGQQLDPGDPRAALDAGVSLVHQELSLVPEMTVAENILLGSTPTSAGFIRRGEMKRIARDALDEIGVEVDLDEPIARLSVAMRQFVEVARAIARKPKVLILDEPTASLTPAETDYLLDMLQRLATRGLAIIYISHRIPEIFRICNRVTVLRDGGFVTCVEIGDTSPERIVEHMVGRDLELSRDSRRQSPEFGDVVLSARRIKAEGVKGVDLDVRAGEIVGLGGLVGAGRTEMVRAMIGADPRSGGEVTITLDGNTRRVTSYHSAVSGGVGYIPEERRADGLALTMSVVDNITLPNRYELSKAGVLQTARINRFALDLAKKVGLRPPEVQRMAGQFSGGNQQKVVIAKWLGREPDIIILDEPTRGVDVGAKAEIHRLVRDLADQGTAVLVISSDLPELLELSDTVHVVRDGAIVGTLTADEADERGVMALASGQAEADLP